MIFIDYMNLNYAIKFYEERVAELKITINDHDTSPFFNDVRHTEAFIAHLDELREDLTNNENLVRWLKELKERRDKEKGDGIHVSGNNSE